MLVLGCNRDGGRVHPPTTIFPYYQQDPVWSKTNLIVYRDNGITSVSPEGGAQDDPDLVGLWVLDPETGERNRVSSIGHSPAWSPDGTRIVFVHLMQIYTMAVDGSDIRQLTFTGDNFFPSWSPDGTRIVFDSNRTGTNALWIMREDGGGQQLVGSSPEIGRMPDWSPIDALLAYISYSSGVHDVYTIEITGEHRRQLTMDERVEDTPRFSPDGSRIVYSGLDKGAQPQLWLIDSTGSEPIQLTRSDRGAIWPSWSPDGSRIVHVAANVFRDDPTFGVLWILDLQSGEEVQLLSRWFD